jgi:hypothetical protein
MKQASIIFENSLSSGGVKIPVGIHSNGDVIFAGCTEGANFYDLNFTNTRTKQVIHKRLFFPEKIYPNEGESLTQALDRQENRVLSFPIYLTAILGGDDALKGLEAKDFKGLMQKVCSKLNEFKNDKVNIKVVLDKSNKYPEIPNYPEFVEKHVPGEHSRLAFSAKELAKINDKEKAQSMAAPSATDDDSV